MRAAGYVGDRAGAVSGPGLSATQDEVDLASVANAQMPEMLISCARRLASAQARMWAVMVQLGRCARFDPADPDSCRRLPEISDWAGGEVSAALAWTGVAADRELALAETVVTRLPQVFTALVDGRLDRAKAAVFAEHLDGLAAEQIERICGVLVPLASGLTTGQLRVRLLRMVHDVDPEHARRRYRRAVRERAVVGWLNEDGTVTVSGSGLPADEAARACARLDRLAEKVQRAGHPGRLGLIQTDLYLGLLDGGLHHLTEQQIIAALLGRRRPEDADFDDQDAPPADSEPDPKFEPEFEQNLKFEPEPEFEPESAAECVPVFPAGCVSDLPAEGPSTPVASPDRVPSPVVGVEIRVGLSTLLRLDERPGEIPGLGPVIAPVARALVAAQNRGAQWWVAVTDAEGYLLLDAGLRRRPVFPDRLGRGCVGGVVELHVTADELTRLAAAGAGAGPWAGVVAEIADRYARRDAYLAALDRCPGGRFAGDALARHVRIRDRFCTFPTCRRPARRCEIDHTEDHAAGGTTTRDNLGPRCDRHHGWKTKGWWSLTSLRPGAVRWRSPLGRTYDVRGEPIRPPTVQPCPRPAQPPTVRRTHGRDDGPILRRPPPGTRQPPTTAPHRPGIDEPPPF